MQLFFKFQAYWWSEKWLKLFDVFWVINISCTYLSVMIVNAQDLDFYSDRAMDKSGESYFFLLNMTWLVQKQQKRLFHPTLQYTLFTLYCTYNLTKNARLIYYIEVRINKRKHFKTIIIFLVNQNTVPFALHLCWIPRIKAKRAWLRSNGLCKSRIFQNL